MKKTLLYLFIGATFFQCTTDQENEAIEENQNLAYEQSLNLATQAPNPALDATNEGLYKGSVVTSDLSFHERINININNDGHVNAQILVNDTDNAAHYLKGNILNAADHTYTFTGGMGSFTLQLDNGEAVISNAIFDNKDAVANVFKSTSARRLANCTLGSFNNNNLEATAAGTWDVMYGEQTTNTAGRRRFNATNITLTLIDGENMTSIAIENSQTVRYESTCAIRPNGNQRSRIEAFGRSGSGEVMIGGLPLVYRFRIRAQNIISNPTPLTECNYPDKTALVVVAPTANIPDNNFWTWNGNDGTFSIELDTLPDFIEVP